MLLIIVFFPVAMLNEVLHGYESAKWILVSIVFALKEIAVVAAAIDYWLGLGFLNRIIATYEGTSIPSQANREKAEDIENYRTANLEQAKMRCLLRKPPSTRHL